ncbi:hypothetical protein ABZT03_04420 [Streptomyces sp. NPDC005574]|uniref:hypothetical protein n=1 Tax=Streptomyces sp. NPDC005574 TaxID=3156891 RepID=UPI0033AAC9B7
MANTWDTPSSAALSEQATVLVALAGLAVSHPDLPGAYFALSEVLPRELAVQLDSPSKVEAWRAALNVPFEKVVLRRAGARTQLKFVATVYGVEFSVYAVYEPDQQVEEARDDAVRAP